MGNVRLYSPETPGLKLGPGTLQPQHTDPEDGGSPDPGRAVIMFVDGFAEFNPDDPDRPWLKDWEKWVKHPGTPYIEVDADEELTPLSEGFPCEGCANTRAPRSFKSQRALAMHLMNVRRGISVHGVKN